MISRRLEGETFPQGLSYNKGTGRLVGKWFSVHFRIGPHVFYWRYRQKAPNYSCHYDARHYQTPMYVSEE